MPYDYHRPLLPQSTEITSGYGGRTHPTEGHKHFHPAIDLSATTGQEVYAVASGKVTFAGWKPKSGNTIEIQHDTGGTSLYAHLNNLSVSKGGVVRRGQVIGGAGNTGLNSTGTHLHFAMTDADGNRFNPNTIFDFPFRKGSPQTAPSLDDRRLPSSTVGKSLDSNLIYASDADATAAGEDKPLPPLPPKPTPQDIIGRMVKGMAERGKRSFESINTAFQKSAATKDRLEGVVSLLKKARTEAYPKVGR